MLKARIPYRVPWLIWGSLFLLFLLFLGLSLIGFWTPGQGKGGWPNWALILLLAQCSLLVFGLLGLGIATLTRLLLDNRRPETVFWGTFIGCWLGGSGGYAVVSCKAFKDFAQHTSLPLSFAIVLLMMAPTGLLERMAGWCGR